MSLSCGITTLAINEQLHQVGCKWTASVRRSRFRACHRGLRYPETESKAAALLEALLKQVDRLLRGARNVTRDSGRCMRLKHEPFRPNER
jgi:hypothetical protein